MIPQMKLTNNCDRICRQDILQFNNKLSKMTITLNFTVNLLIINNPKYLFLYYNL